MPSDKGQSLIFSRTATPKFVVLVCVLCLRVGAACMAIAIPDQAQVVREAGVLFFLLWDALVAPYIVQSMNKLQFCGKSCFFRFGMVNVIAVKAQSLSVAADSKSAVCHHFSCKTCHN